MKKKPKDLRQDFPLQFPSTLSNPWPFSVMHHKNASFSSFFTSHLPHSFSLQLTLLTTIHKTALTSFSFLFATLFAPSADAMALKVILGKFAIQWAFRVVATGNG
jgi:hypothetical protein